MNKPGPGCIPCNVNIKLADDIGLVVLRMLVVYEQHVLTLFAQAVAQVLQDGGATLQHAVELLVGLDDRGSLSASDGPDDSLALSSLTQGLRRWMASSRGWTRTNMLEGLTHLLGFFGVDLLPAQMLVRTSTAGSSTSRSSLASGMAVHLYPDSAGEEVLHEAALEVFETFLVVFLYFYFLIHIGEN